MREGRGPPRIKELKGFYGTRPQDMFWGQEVGVLREHTFTSWRIRCDMGRMQLGFFKGLGGQGSYTSFNKFWKKGDNGKINSSEGGRKQARNRKTGWQADPWSQTQRVGSWAAVGKGWPDGGVSAHTAKTSTFPLKWYCCSVDKPRPTLLIPRAPGFHVPHHFPELAHTHVHWVGDAIQPSHPLSPPSPPALNLSPHQEHQEEGKKHWLRLKSSTPCFFLRTPRVHCLTRSVLFLGTTTFGISSLK